MGTNFYVHPLETHLGKRVREASGTRFYWAVHPAKLLVTHDLEEIVRDEYDNWYSLIGFIKEIASAQQDYTNIGEEFS